MGRDKTCYWDYVVGIVCFSFAVALFPEASAKVQEGGSMKSPIYKQGRITHSAPGYPRKVVMFISLEPKYFVTEEMKVLARELRNVLPAEPRLGVVILDDTDALVNTSPIHRTSEYLLARRAYYSIDRLTGEEFIQFATQRNKPWNEIRICLGRPIGRCSDDCGTTKQQPHKSKTRG